MSAARRGCLLVVRYDQHTVSSPCKHPSASPPPPQTRRRGLASAETAQGRRSLARLPVRPAARRGHRARRGLPRPRRPRATQARKLAGDIISLHFPHSARRADPLHSQFRDLLAKPHIYHSVSLAHLPHVHPQLLAFLPSILSGTRHLSLRSFPSTTLSHLFSSCSGRLTTLDLSFSGVTDSDLLVLAATASARPHSTALCNLQTLRLKGCRRISSFFALLCPTSRSAQTPPLQALRNLDLSWSSTSSLPLPLSVHLPSLKHLNLSTTPYLPLDHLTRAIEDFPHGLESLDLSHLWLSAADLSGLSFTPRPPTVSFSLEADARSPRAFNLGLSGNDSLTLSSLSSLKALWASRLAPLDRRIEVEHSAMLLESDEEEDVRRFVEMVAGVVMRGREVEARASASGGSGASEERRRRSL